MKIATQQKLLYDVATSGDIEQLTELIQSGVSLDFIGDNQYSALLRAVVEQNYVAIESLLAVGANMDISNQYGNAWDYMKDDHTRNLVKEAYLNRKIPKDSLDKQFREFFIDAVREGTACLDKLKTLVYVGADANKVWEKEQKTALQFCFTDSCWGEGQMAAPDLISTLLGTGADVNIQDKDGKTVLMYEVENCKYGWRPIWRDTYKIPRLQLLLDAGANVHLKDKGNMTTLTMAMMYDQDEIIKPLKKAGAKRNITDEWWLNLYIYWNNKVQYKQAIREEKNEEIQEELTSDFRFQESRFEQTVKKLLSKGVDVNTTVTTVIYPNTEGEILKGQTAIMYLAKCADSYHIRTLIDEGATTDFTDDAGRTVLHYLALASPLFQTQLEDDSRVMSLLYDLKRAHPLKIQEKDRYGKTVLDYAVASGQTRLAEEMVALSSKADQIKCFSVIVTKQEQPIVANFIEKVSLTVPSKPQTIADSSFFANELWSYSNGDYAAASGASYFFTDDGRYLSEQWYSGGMYWKTSQMGTYQYAPKEKMITLKVEHIENGGRVRMSMLPKTKIHIHSISPTEVSLRSGDTTTLTLSNVYDRNKTVGLYLLPVYNKVEVDSLTITVSINNRPFKQFQVDPSDIKLVAQAIQSSKTKIGERKTPSNAICLTIEGDLRISIWPDLGWIQYQGSSNTKEKMEDIYKLEPSATLLLNELLSHYLKE